MNNNKTNDEEKKLYIGWISLGVGILVISMWLLTYFLLRGRGAEVRGTFGDMFGSVNAVYSGLAFAGIIITIYLQSHELKLQRKELKETRREFEKQNETLTKQQFENTFFQLLSLFHENIDKIHSSSRGELYNGKDVFTVFRNDINGNISVILRKRIADQDSDIILFPDQMKEERENINSVDLVGSYWSAYRTYDNVLTPYFSTINIILQFVHESYIEDKHFYASIISSQLSRDECLVLFINTLTLNKDSIERNLIEKYNIVDDLDMDKLPNPTIFLDYLKQKK